jgi:hypothetical protein
MTTIAKKSLKVGKFVNTEHVDTVIRTYKQERWIHNSERIGKEDSLSAWFSVEELEEFIATGKEQGADGIKFYFAAYPENFTEKPEYAGRQTIVMVATKSKETMNGTVNKDIYVTTDQGDSTILSYNMASLCPPYCSSFGSKSDIRIGDINSPVGSIGAAIIDRGEKGFIVI